MLTVIIIYVAVCSISAQTLQENVAPLLSLLRESVQLNLAPPGHFLLLGSVLNTFFTFSRFIYCQCTMQGCTTKCCCPFILRKTKVFRNALQSMT